MQTEIIISGFGGQGVLFAGQLISYAAMDSNLEVTWIPSYGPEMRGGTANCTVVVSDEEIGAPVVRNPEIALVLNLPSLDKYEETLQTGGLMVINSSMVNRLPNREDIKIVSIPGNEIAEKIGNKRVLNMVMLGAMFANHKVLPLSAIEKALHDHLPARHHGFLQANIEALRAGNTYLS
ncbi:MAG: 2-oxoacid:acceptor oxidoreductase family protein [Anaerolineaceae bacterium]|nr:2-oxoacid:acceptor oxidoreductase family protein [Anaerolineaceae bacterium]